MRLRIIPGAGTTGSRAGQSGSLLDRYGISGREEDIIRLRMAGRLNLSARAVEYHITKIYRKCGVNNKYDLLNMFR